jgi:hypothetical protein
MVSNLQFPIRLGPVNCGALQDISILTFLQNMTVLPQGSVEKYRIYKWEKTKKTKGTSRKKAIC